MSLFSKEDLKNAEVTSDVGTLPPGKYLAQVEDATSVATKANDGRYIKLKFRILSGQFAKWCVFHNLNFENKNPKAVEIARSQMKQFLTSAGIPLDKQEVKNVDQLLGLTVVIKTAIETSPGYSDKSVVKGFASEESLDAMDKHLGTTTTAAQTKPTTTKNMFS